MAKKKQTDESTRIPRDILRMARIIAAIEDLTLSELLGDTLRPIFTKKMNEYLRKGIDVDAPPKKP